MLEQCDDTYEILLKDGTHMIYEKRLKPYSSDEYDISYEKKK